MIDSRERRVIFGENDVKSLCCDYGFAFGDSSVPDTDDIEECYMFGIQIFPTDVPELYRLLQDVLCGKRNEFDFCKVSFVFKDMESANMMLNMLFVWVERYIENGEHLRDWLKLIAVENKKEE